MTTQETERLFQACPPRLAPRLVELLDLGTAFLVLLDPDGKIHWANQTFTEALLAAREGPPPLEPEAITFRETLCESSAKLFQQIGLRALSEKGPIDLQHSTGSGTRTVKYKFFPAYEGLVVALGSDRTDELELVAQMSTLIEDLGQEIELRNQLSQELARLAITDFLTGVYNRRHFDKTLQQEWGRFKRYGTGFALLICDLDGFKQINDQHGHQAGDEVLKRVAEILKDEVRSEDVVARYGGEEFVVIAHGASLENGRDLGERLRRKIEASKMPAGVPQATITAGVVATLPSFLSIHEFLAAADAALYRGKETGRNRVVVHGAPSPAAADSAPGASRR